MWIVRRTEVKWNKTKQKAQILKYKTEKIKPTANVATKRHQLQLALARIYHKFTVSLTHTPTQTDATMTSQEDFERLRLQEQREQVEMELEVQRNRTISMHSFPKLSEYYTRK